jgi:small-conductance mechanosensitive channel
MKKISATVRIAFSLAALSVSLLFGAQLVGLVPYGSDWQRIAMMLVGIGGSALLFVLWRRGRDEPALRERRLRPVLLGGLLLAGAALALAAVSNVLGWLGRAVFLTQGVTRSLLAALGLLTLFLVGRDLLWLVLLTRPLQHLRSIGEHTDAIRTRLHGTLTLAGVVLWIWAVLAAFEAFDVVLAGLRWVFGASFSIGQTTIMPGTILVFVLSVWGAVYASRLLRFVLDEDVLPRLSLPRGVPGAISASVHYVVVALAILFASTVAGFDLTKLTIILGALGVGIGFGLQNIINNFIWGLILLFERPLQVGDDVLVGELMGTVRKIGIRASIVRTYEGSEVIVPNGDLISQQVVNYTLSDRRRRLEITVGLAYGSDPERAIDVVTRAAQADERVLSFPAPLVLFDRFGDSSLDFRVLFWVGDFDHSLGTRSAVGIQIEKALKEAGFTIPFPQRDVHVRPVEAD